MTFRTRPRDELAAELMKANQTTVSAEAMYEQEADEYAEALISAGYSKQRTIETHEELAELANGAVIKTLLCGKPEGRTWGKVEGIWWGIALESPESPVLPALVLHEPTP